MENVRNRLSIDFSLKNEFGKTIKQPSKSIFNGIHKSYENCGSYVFNQNEVLTDKPIYLGFAILKNSELHMYETIYDPL